MKNSLFFEIFYCHKTQNYLEDWIGIDKLPDEILVFILSLLPTEEVITTSVLACRWHYLFRARWCEHRESFKCSTSHSHSLWFVSIRTYIPPFLVQRKRFVDWVNQVLNLHKGTHLDEFRLHFSMYGDNFKSDINSWISFAFQKGVKRLHLIFTCN